MALFYVPQKCTASLLSLKYVPFTCITMHDSSYKVTNTNDGKFVKFQLNWGLVFFYVFIAENGRPTLKNLV